VLTAASLGRLGRNTQLADVGEKSDAFNRRAARGVLRKVEW